VTESLGYQNTNPRARQLYKVDCSKVKLEQEGEMSCGKVWEEGLQKVKLEQEGEESWEGSVKKVAEMRAENTWREIRCEQKIRGASWVELEPALAVGV